jgi:hypothetical protein
MTNMLRKWIDRFRRNRVQVPMKLLERENAIARFQSVDEALICQIRDLIESLPMSTVNDTEPHRAIASAALRGTVDDVVIRLSDVLKKDYAEYQRGGVTWAGGFEYVLRWSDEAVGRLEILTRLFGREPAGGIYYGRYVQRIGPQSYVLWIDD